jgi:hypothetical protein
MSKLSPGAARLLGEARDLLGPEREMLSHVRDALGTKLEAGVDLSCGELDEFAFPYADESTARVARGWFGSAKIGLATGLVLLGSAAYFALRSPAEQAPDRSHAQQPLSAVNALSQPAEHMPEPRLVPEPRPLATLAPVPSEVSSQPGAGLQPAGSTSKRSAPVVARAGAAASAQPLQRRYAASTANGVRSDALTAERGAASLAAHGGDALRPTSENAVDASLQAAAELRSSALAHGAPQVSAERDLLEREVAMIEGARAALERGDEARALVILDAHAREFPHGVLAEEQWALRARALCESGNFAAGRDAVRRLAARSPGSPHLQASSAACGAAH